MNNSVNKKDISGDLFLTSSSIKNTHYIREEIERSKFGRVKKRKSSSTAIYYVFSIPNDLVEGIYLGPVQCDFGVGYEIETDKGKVVIHCYLLHRVMVFIRKGSLVRIKNLGQKTINTGLYAGCDYNEFQVLVAKRKK